MLSYFLSGTRYNKGRKRGDIEGVFAISACTAKIHGIILGDFHRNAQLQHGFTETSKLLHSDTSHEVNRHECCNLTGIVASGSDIFEHFASLLL